MELQKLYTSKSSYGSFNQKAMRKAIFKLLKQKAEKNYILNS